MQDVVVCLLYNWVAHPGNSVWETEQEERMAPSSRNRPLMCGMWWQAATNKLAYGKHCHHEDRKFRAGPSTQGRNYKIKRKTANWYSEPWRLSCRSLSSLGLGLWPHQFVTTIFSFYITKKIKISRPNDRNKAGNVMNRETPVFETEPNEKQYWGRIWASVHTLSFSFFLLYLLRWT